MFCGFITDNCDGLWNVILNCQSNSHNELMLSDNMKLYQKNCLNMWYCKLNKKCILWWHCRGYLIKCLDFMVNAIGKWVRKSIHKKRSIWDPQKIDCCTSYNDQINSIVSHCEAVIIWDVGVVKIYHLLWTWITQVRIKRTVWIPS